MSSRLTRLVVIALVVCIAATASATTTRINSLGGGFKSLTVMDDQNIFLLPSEVVRYGNVAVLELGGDDYYLGNEENYTSFLFTYELSETMVLGFYGSDALVPAASLFTGLAPTDLNFGEEPNNHRGSIVFGMGALDAMHFGARLGFYGQSNKFESDEGSEEYGPSILDIGAGIGMPMGEGALDIGVQFMNGSAKLEYGEEPPYGNEFSQKNFGVIARLSMPKGDADETLIPFVAFESMSADAESNQPESGEVSSSMTSFAVGADLNIPLGTNSFIQPGVGVASMSGKYEPADAEFTSSVKTMPFFNVAAEIQVWQWMNFRFGGAQYVDFGKEEDDDGATEEHSFVEHSLATGVGVILPGDVAIDLQIETNWWRNGPYIVSGNTNTFGVSAAISKAW